MIDFWEALGRMARDEDMSAKFAVLEPSLERRPYIVIEGKHGLDIPPDEYGKIQSFFAPLLAQGTLSIMAAGELFWAFTFKDTADNIAAISKVIKDAGQSVAGSSSGYYIALGMIISDRYLRDYIKNDAAKVGGAPEAEPSTFEYGPHMSARERSGILKLACMPDFNDACLTFCRYPWDGHNCSVTARLWDGHIHCLALSKPVAVPAAVGGDH